MKRIAVVAVLIASCLRAELARAESPEDDPGVTLGQVLERVRARSPRAAAEAAVVDVAAAERIEARLRPNPTLGYGLAGVLRGADVLGSSEHSVTVGIPLLVGGKRAARVALAERVVAAARASLAAGVAERVRDAAQIYAALVAAGERVTVLEQAVIDIEAIEKVIAGRAASGASSQYHVERMGLEVSRLRVRLAELQAERDDLAGLLARLAGAPGWLPRPAAALAPLGVDVVGAGVDGEADATARLPALDAARSAEQAAIAAVHVARTERWPVPELLVGGVASTDLHGVAGVVGVSVPLPMFDRAQGLVARAAAEARAAELAREAVAAEALAELERARRLLTSRRAALGTFEEGALARLPALRAMAERAYLLGQSGIAELLDTIESVIDMRLDHVALVEAVLAAEIDYLAAAGRLDELR